MSDLATQGTPVITSPPLFYPSNWSQANINDYISQFNARANAGIPNYAPWWITNPEWSQSEVSFTSVNDPSRTPGYSAGYINPASGAWIDTTQTERTPTTTTPTSNNTMLILLILMSMRNY